MADEGQQPGTPPAAGASSTSASQTPGTATAPPKPATSIGPETEGPDHVWSLELFYWGTRTHPNLLGGKGALDFENLKYPGNGGQAPGAQLSIPVSPHDILRVSYFQLKGNGATTASQDLDLFTTLLPKGDVLSAKYKVQAFKVSFEALLYPYPVTGHKLRFKSLWEIQYANMSSRIDAPFDTTTDSTGVVSFPSATSSRRVILPTLGAAMQYVASPRLNLEARVSGFGIPHHSDILDAEGSVAYRISRVQVIGGGKFYHFESSPQNEQFFRASIAGVFVGLRWLGK